MSTFLNKKFLDTATPSWFGTVYGCRHFVVAAVVVLLGPADRLSVIGTTSPV